MRLSNGAKVLSLRPSVLSERCSLQCTKRAHVRVCVRLKSPQLLSLHGQPNAVGAMSACVNAPFHLIRVTAERHVS